MILVSKPTGSSRLAISLLALKTGAFVSGTDLTGILDQSDRAYWIGTCWIKVWLLACG